MDLNLAFDALRQRIVDGYTPRTLPILWENPADEEKPVDGWIYCEIEATDGRQITLAPPGDREMRDYGHVIMVVGVPFGSGPSLVEAEAVRLRKVFDPQHFFGTHIHIRDRTIQKNLRLDYDLGGRWRTVTVKIDFCSDNRE